MSAHQHGGWHSHGEGEMDPSATHHHGPCVAATSPAATAALTRDERRGLAAVYGYEAGRADATAGLDAAWAEAEAALPEGWIGPWVQPIPDDGTWSADATSLRRWRAGGDEFEDELVMEQGQTPAAALRALTEKLREGR